MIRIAVHRNEKLIVQAMGFLGETDVIEMGKQLRALPLARAPWKAVFHLEGLRGVRAPAPGASLVDGSKLRGRHVARIALLGDRRFERAVRRLVSHVIHGEIRYFGLSQTAQARRWLNRPGLGMLPHRLLPARV